MTAPATLLTLDALRPAAAAVLVRETDTDPYVHEDIVDSLEPPSLLLEWDDPWLEAGVGLATMGPCLYTARLQIACVAGRLEPGAGVDVLEQLVAHVLGRMRSDAYRWPLDRVSAPFQRDLAGVSYLACNVVYAVPVSV